jgi:hypothetical protein
MMLPRVAFELFVRVFSTVQCDACSKFISGYSLGSLEITAVELAYS